MLTVDITGCWAGQVGVERAFLSTGMISISCTGGVQITGTQHASGQPALLAVCSWRGLLPDPLTHKLLDTRVSATNQNKQLPPAFNPMPHTCQGLQRPCHKLMKQGVLRLCQVTTLVTLSDVRVHNPNTEWHMPAHTPYMQKIGLLGKQAPATERPPAARQGIGLQHRGHDRRSIPVQKAVHTRETALGVCP
jgi:hypothetical protein